MLFNKYTVSLALALSFLASAPPTWSAAAPATKYPILPRLANQSTLGRRPMNEYKKYIADATCSPEEKLVERAAWRDALQYAQALASWQPNNSFQPAMDLYMGNDSRGQLSATLRANIDGAVRVHDLSTWPENQKLFVFCIEPDIFAIAGGLCTISTAIAYEFNDIGAYYDNHYIVFCPSYYTHPPLYKTLPTFNALPAERLATVPEEQFYGTQALIYFHESLHLADLTTPVHHEIYDGVVDYDGHENNIYGPYNVAKMAETENTAACLHIADAYSCTAAAIFAQQRYNLTDPPKPMAPVLPRDPAWRIRGRNFQIPQSPQLPDPNTPDNRIISNEFRIGPVASVAQDSLQKLVDHNLTLGSSSRFKRVVWPQRFSCTPENGCTRSMAVTVATTISGPLICFLVAGLCVLSFIL